ncbi:MAG: hypothetical protein ABEJ93_05040, partial [Candidatus Nanohalobium sp.]
LIRLPIALVGSIKMGIQGVWIAFIVSNVLGALIAYLLYRRGSWKQRVTEEDRQKGQVAEETDDYGETITDSVAEKLRSLASRITDTFPF